MFNVVHFLLCVLKISFVHCQLLPPYATPNSDQCIDLALQRWYVPAGQKFPQLMSFTLSMPSSRQLYDNLFIHTFTTESFKEYCQNYRIGRNEYERCPNSDRKTLAMAGYGLADYICVQRVEEFANALPCLQRSVQESMSICGPQCPNYEMGYDYNHQMVTGAGTTMASDCRHLKCMADCERPRVANACGQVMASMIHDALQTTVVSMETQYKLSFGQQSVSFPQECRSLAMNAFSTLPVAIPFNPQIVPGAVPNPQSIQGSVVFPNPQSVPNPFVFPNPQSVPNPFVPPNPQLVPNPFVPNPQSVPYPVVMPNPNVVTGGAAYPYPYYPRPPSEAAKGRPLSSRLTILVILYHIYLFF